MAAPPSHEPPLFLPPCTLCLPYIKGSSALFPKAPPAIMKLRECVTSGSDRVREEYEPRLGHGEERVENERRWHISPGHLPGQTVMQTCQTKLLSKRQTDRQIEGDGKSIAEREREATGVLLARTRVPEMKQATPPLASVALQSLSPLVPAN
ncbi:unnamed protein product [Pleuronectes platessa]|uniref:Uncharacterized protein n=1 Tax=Pleuronectes platessa TaxID=8262 RepID=A0A9N7W133_PLEPL|nr:unnamed protein product [Pleuronectes platessa]